ncbi:MAG: hypothetical protein EHM23_00005 [Acidobacteria bacterium]|nr:MAG: hypothetical protein EHM23_00005 [Acidobacteriota bacterium]
MTWKVEVQADNTGTWAGNALRFEYELIARQYARDLMSRWTAVRDYRIVEVDDPVNESTTSPPTE